MHIKKLLLLINLFIVSSTSSMANMQKSSSQPITEFEQQLYFHLLDARYNHIKNGFKLDTVTDPELESTAKSLDSHWQSKLDETPVTIVEPAAKKICTRSNTALGNDKVDFTKMPGGINRKPKKHSKSTLSL